MMKRGVILGVALAALVVMSSAGICAALTKEQVVAQARVKGLKLAIRELENKIAIFKPGDPITKNERALLEKWKAELAHWEQQLNELQHQK